MAVRSYMFTFTPLDGDQVIDNISLTLDALHELRCHLQSALDYNPASDKFAAAMTPAREMLGGAFDPWLSALKKIRTEGEREDRITFMFEDWISTWRIADFIDRTWTIARVKWSPEESKQD